MIQKFRKTLYTLLIFMALMHHEPTSAYPLYSEGCCEQTCCTDHFDWGGVTVYGDWLFWRVVQDQMQYAAVIPGGIQPIIDAFSGPGPVQLAEHLVVYEPSSKYRSGARIGLISEIPCTCWEIGLAWTTLQGKMHSRVFDPTNGVIPINAPATTLFGFIGMDPTMFGFGTEATSHWKFEFNTVDLTIGRSIDFDCDCFSLSPYLGIKGASIKSDQEVRYFGFSFNDVPIFISVDKKNHFNGVGPSFGLSSNWEFLTNWKLKGEVCAALLCGKFAVQQRPFAALPPNFIGVTVDASRKFRIRPMLDAAIGLDWDLYACRSFGISMGVAYEIQYWWHQWQLPGSIVSTVVTSGASAQGDLTLYGLTADFRVRF
jgi:hypothetical protein